MFVYLPSCKFTQGFPEASRKIREYLAKRDGVRVAGCCSIAVKEMTAQDISVTVCMSCAGIVRETGGQGNVISIWEYLLQDENFPWPDFGGEAITLQDCWRARNDDALLDAVRECMRRMNIAVVELVENRKNCGFDGVWRMNPLPPAAMKRAPGFFGEAAAAQMPVPKEEQPQRMREHAAQYTTQRAAGYCNACVAGMKMGGADAYHLMELAVQNLK